MPTDEAIIQEFKKLVVTRLYDKITVADICKKADISRKTFYAHFQDKDAILEKIISEDTIHPVNDMRRLLRSENMKSASRLINEMMYRNIYDNREFYENLFLHGGELLFITLASKLIINQNMHILSSSRLSDKEREYMAYFYATANTMLVKKWIRNGFDLSTKQLARHFDEWALCRWATVVNAAEKR